VSVINIMIDNRSADGQSQDTAAVLLDDAAGNPVTNTPVTLTVGTGATLADSTCTTNAYGVCTVGITAPAPGSYPVSVTAPVQLGPVMATFAGTASQINSALVITTNSQPANDASENLAQVTLHDSNGNPVSGQSVTLTVATGAQFASNAHTEVVNRASPGSSPTAPLAAPAQQVNCTTDAQGVCTVGLESATPGSYVVATTAPVALGPVSAVFGPPVPGAPSATISSLTISQDGASANGLSEDLAQATLLDANANPIPNVLVAFTADTGATLANPACMTSANGVCTVGLTSTTAGQYKVSASAGALSLGPRTATFIPVCSTAVTTNCGAAAADASKSAIVVTINNATADSQSQDTVQVTLHDSNGNPVAGVQVTLQSGAGSTLEGTCLTGADGRCAEGVTSAVAGGYLVEATGPIAIGPVAARFMAASPPQPASIATPALDPRMLAVLMALLALIALRNVRRTR
jgi:adhesin/invasin